MSIWGRHWGAGGRVLFWVGLGNLKMKCHFENKIEMPDHGVGAPVLSGFSMRVCCALLFDFLYRLYIKEDDIFFCYFFCTISLRQLLFFALAT